LITNQFKISEDIDLNDKIDSDTVSDDSEESIINPIIDYTIEELKSKTVQELPVICKKFNIRPGKRLKGELGNHIYSIVNDTKRSEKIASMNNNLKDIEFSNTPLHHIWYKTNFNT